MPKSMRIFLPFYFLFFLGCTTYQLPIQTQNHPASAHTREAPFELLPILELPEKEMQVCHDESE